jgi:hypothetical protein
MFTPRGAMGAIGRKGAPAPFLGETLYIIVYMLGALQSIPVAHWCLFTNLHFVGMIRAARQHRDSTREEGSAHKSAGGDVRLVESFVWHFTFSVR